MAMSDYLEAATINDNLRAGDVYIALFTTDPTDADTGTEVATASYAREAVSDFEAPADGVTQNATEISFTQATESWGTVTHAGIYDTLTNGNLLFHGALSASKTIDTNDTFKIAASGFSVTVS